MLFTFLHKLCLKNFVAPAFFGLTGLFLNFRPRGAVPYTLPAACESKAAGFKNRLSADILKHTHKNNPDHGALVAALAGLREVMSHINEDKRKTEGQLQMFDIYNDIDQCPVRDCRCPLTTSYVIL